jgi:HEAT repeat protein
MSTAPPADAALARFLSDPSTESGGALAAAGLPALRRTVQLYFGTAGAPFADPTDGLGKDGVDRWTSALAVVAAAQPRAFMDEIADREPSLAILVILGDVDDARAAAMLAAHVRDADWLVRCNVARALGRRADARSREALEVALGDEELIVRAAAIAAIASTQPGRALALYKTLLKDGRLTPTMRSDVTAAVEALRVSR